MTTSGSDPAPPGRSFVPTEARALSVEFTDDEMNVHLTDGRSLSTPLVWFPRLLRATPEQRARCEISGGGIGLHWPEVDEDLLVANLLAGADKDSF
jgi:hypothetical protein